MKLMYCNNLHKQETIFFDVCFLKIVFIFKKQFRELKKNSTKNKVNTLYKSKLVIIN